MSSFLASVPTGTVPVGSLPTGTVPTGSLPPTGTVPTGSLPPTGTVPTGSLPPSGTVPSSIVATGVVPGTVQSANTPPNSPGGRFIPVPNQFGRLVKKKFNRLVDTQPEVPFRSMGNFLGCAQVEESTIALTMQRGKFKKELQPGIRCVPWCIGVRVGETVSTKIQKLAIQCECITKDKIPLTLVVSLHYKILDAVNNAKKTIFVATNPKSFIEDHAFDIIETIIFKEENVDNVFDKKTDLAGKITTGVNEVISEIGFGIVRTVILKIAAA